MAKKWTGATYEKGQLYKLAIEDIQANPNQPRKYFDEEGLADLTRSIADKGVIQPIICRVNEEGNVMLVTGERRLKAAQNAGLSEIPSLFIDSEKPEEIALIENSLRQNLTAMEEAEAAGRLVNELQYTHEQMAKILGKKRQTIGEILSLNRLPAKIRDECRTNPNCPRRVLVEIARKKQERGMISLYKRYKEKGLTSDEIRKEVKRERKDKSPDGQAGAIVTGIAALRTRLEKIDWTVISADERVQIQEAFTALTDAFRAMASSSPVVAEEGNMRESENKIRRDSFSI